VSRRALAWFALGLLSGPLVSVPLFLLPYGLAVLILAGLIGATLGALVWLCPLLPLVRYLALDRYRRAARPCACPAVSGPPPFVLLHQGIPPGVG